MKTSQSGPGVCHYIYCPYLPEVDFHAANGSVTRLCQPHLNLWLDNADDDDQLEPTRLSWPWGVPPSELVS